MAVDVLLSKGVPEERILFLNLIASPEGAQNFAAKFPRLRVVTAFVDQGLNDKKYVCLCSSRQVTYTNQKTTATSFPGSATSVIDSIPCRLEEHILHSR